jgi:hypothetical protein
MLQIKTFALPAEEAAANEFLKTHKPLGDISYNDAQLFIAYDDGASSPEHQIADLQELIKSAQASRLQQEIALHVMQYQIADLNPKHNKGRYEEINNGIIQQKAAIDLQDTKIAFVQGKIDALRTQ